jgi:hypothetical protein
MTKYSITATWHNLTPFGRLLIGLISLLLIACTAFSCFSTLVVILLPVPTSTPQAAPTFTISLSPDIHPDFTPLPGPSLTPPPTRRVHVTNTPPIHIITPTNTFMPFLVRSATPTPTIFPRNKAACSCTGEKKLACSDFPNQKQAQACYDFCSSQGFGDIHNLDENSDGIACNYMLRPPKTP